MGGYTPGPWEFNPSIPLLNQWGAGPDLYCATVAVGEQAICVVAHDGLEDEEAIANARLIASAPELLEALQKVEAHLSAIGTPRDAHGRYHKDGEWTFDEALPRDVDAREVKSAFEVARAAISRATGEGE